MRDEVRPVKSKISANEKLRGERFGKLPQRIY